MSLLLCTSLCCIANVIGQGILVALDFPSGTASLSSAFKGMPSTFSTLPLPKRLRVLPRPDVVSPAPAKAIPPSPPLFSASSRFFPLYNYVAVDAPPPPQRLWASGRPRSRPQQSHRPAVRPYSSFSCHIGCHRCCSFWHGKIKH